MCLQLLIFLLSLSIVLLQDKNGKVSGCIVSAEELEYFLLNLLLGTSVLEKEIFDVLFDLIVGRINTQLFQFFLCLRQMSQSLGR